MMVTFIALMIENEAAKSTEAGKKKYRAYFVRVKCYARYKDEVDGILAADGYEDCIVTE